MNLLTAEQVAAKLQIHIKSVYKNRDIPRLEITPGVIRFNEDDVDNWLRSKITRKAKPLKRQGRRSVFMRHSSGDSLDSKVS